MHQGGGRHRGKQHPSKDGNARQGKHQKPDTEQYTDPCGSTEGGPMDRIRLPRGRGNGILYIRATQLEQPLDRRLHA